MKPFWKLSFAAAIAAVVIPASRLHAEFTVSGGSATLTIDEGLAASISTFNAYFNATATRTQVLSDPAPGNAAFSRPSQSSVQLVDPIRPYGEIPSPFPGTPGVTRSPQVTTLTIENPSNVLASWTPSSDSYAFVGSGVLGEQIAFTSMQRYTGPFTGSLLYGDFGLRYVPGRASGDVSGLVLTSNIDFLNAAWADLGNVDISVTGNLLSITGDLLISGGLTILDQTAVLGTPFGKFEMTANLYSPNQPVPEPSTLVMLLGCGGVGLVWYRKRRHQA